jgi:hypothetical protein
MKMVIEIVQSTVMHAHDRTSRATQALNSAGSH